MFRFAAIVVTASALTLFQNQVLAFSHDTPLHSAQVAESETNFASLMNRYAQGTPARASWAGWWWAYKENGIARGIGSSSPAARYDAAHGGVTHAKDWEVEHHGVHVPGLQSWQGHSDGWAAAAILYPEPKAPVTVNGVVFSVADQKALLSEAAMEAKGDRYGNRCESNCNPSNPDYLDVVPNQYFLVLTNEMGKNRNGIVLDRYTGSEDWSQPIAGYRFEFPTPTDYLGADPKHPGTYKVNVRGTVWWMEDGVAPDVASYQYPFQFENNAITSSRALSMELWLDGPIVFDQTGRIVSSGNVVLSQEGSHTVGGTWKMGDSDPNLAWPDTLFVPKGVGKNTGLGNPEIDADWIAEHLVATPSQQDAPTLVFQAEFEGSTCNVKGDGTLANCCGVKHPPQSIEVPLRNFSENIGPAEFGLSRDGVTAKIGIERTDRDGRLSWVLTPQCNEDRAPGDSSGLTARITVESLEGLEFDVPCLHQKSPPVPGSELGVESTLEFHVKFLGFGAPPAPTPQPVQIVQ